MSAENVELARRLWERVIEGGRTGRVDMALSEPGWDADLEYVEDPNWPGAGTYRGLEAVRARFEEYMEIFGATDITLEEILDAGDQLVCIFRTEGKSAQSGLPFEHEWAWIWRFREGQVVAMRAYFHTDEALEAAGLQA
jgi:ketosteroid isomerase-like protein